MTNDKGGKRRPWRRVRRFFDAIRSQFSSDPLDRCRWMRLPSSLQNTSEKPKDRLARAGEDAAADFLEDNGYVILHRNIRFPEGELDIVARQDAELVFVEVKTRQSDEFGSPELAVSPNKQRRQMAAAGRFISLCRLHHVPVRFDIVSVLWTPDAPPKIEHHRNAYRANDLFRR